LLDEIKAYWYRLKTEYENRYMEPFLRDYEKSKEYFKKMQAYLLKKQVKSPSNVDIVCTLASVNLELRDDETKCIELLEEFLNRFGDILDKSQKARIYTNIAFYDDFSKCRLDCLIKAHELKSPFVETYKALGLYYFSEYQLYKDETNLSLSKKYFKIAMDMDTSYEYAFDYAVCLYEHKEYQKAKEIFIDLLKRYPDRMRLMLSISYCEAYLGNNDKAKFYLQKLRPGQDDNYSLNTDDIFENEIFDLYYVLEEYDTFLSCWSEDIICQYYIADWEHYFYVLWLKNKKKLFRRFEEENRSYFEKAIEEAKVDEDFDSEDERQETIESWEKDKKEFEEMIFRIKESSSKPSIHPELYPEFSCFMIDCVRHKFV
jgi:hypothetical protein